MNSVMNLGCSLKGGHITLLAQRLTDSQEMLCLVVILLSGTLLFILELHV
jgi:hypothetical protein